MCCLVAQSNKVQCCLHNHTARKELSQSELSLSLQWAGMVFVHAVLNASKQLRICFSTCSLLLFYSDHVTKSDAKYPCQKYCVFHTSIGCSKMKISPNRRLSIHGLPSVHLGGMNTPARSKVARLDADSGQRGQFSPL